MELNQDIMSRWLIEVLTCIPKYVGDYYLGARIRNGGLLTMKYFAYLVFVP